MNLALTKRQKIVIAAALLTLGLLFTQTASVFVVRYKMLAGLSLLALLLTLWSLKDDLTRVKGIVLPILPVLFTLGAASAYFLIEVRWLTRIPALIFFGLSFYFLLLSENVFNVAAERAIPLYWAASTANFVYTILTSYFLFSVISALDLAFYLNFLLVGIVSFLLILQVLWSIKMEKITLPCLIYSFFLAVLVGECALALSFWPLGVTSWSLILSAVLYALLGITSEIFKDRLNKRVVGEYVVVGGSVLLLVILITSWTG